MQFVLNIRIGNEAMQTGLDVALALDNVSKFLQSHYAYDILNEDSNIADFSQPIYDANGNKVGSFCVGLA